MESFAADLATMVRIPLEPEHGALVRKRGTVVCFAAGEVVQEPGKPTALFHVVLDGEVEAVDPVPMRRMGAATLGPGQFFGDLQFLSGGVSLGRAGCDGERGSLRAARGHAQADVGHARDERHHRHGAGRASPPGGRTLRCSAEPDRVGGEPRHVAGFAARNRIPYHEIELGSEEALAAACGIEAAVPGVVFGRDHKIEPATPRGVALALGLDLSVGTGTVFDVLPASAGPAGVAAGVYAGAEGLKALVVEDLALGGQAGTSSRIENDMGFPTGISGGDLVGRGEVQAMKFGTRIFGAAPGVRIEAVQREGVSCRAGRRAAGQCSGADRGHGCAESPHAAGGVWSGSRATASITRPWKGRRAGARTARVR